MFGNVSAESPVDAVVRRLRAAIALGFLADGARLPREADLAHQLGVTVFAMREALAALRDEGLIETRPGNRGGSFVRPGTDRSLLTTGELRRMSAIELRDLGDWRQMLTCVSAELAALRASESNCRHLREYADDLGSAESELDARRAHGRFHLELAAAAQSRRMTEAQIGMYEEFDWLFGLALADPAWRRRSAEELAAVAHAVSAHDADAASSAAKTHAESTVAALNGLRLAAIARDVGASRRNRATPKQLASELERVVAEVGVALRAIAARATEIMSGPFTESELRTGLAKVAMAGIAATDLDLDGLGFHTEPGLVPGHEYWIGWWKLSPEGPATDRAHAMDPRRDDFYDYTRMEFWSGARDTGELYAQGPYIDYGGANDYIVTLALPAYANGEFLGNAGADIRVAAFERRLASYLAGSDPCAAINSERRIVVANRVNHAVGDVLDRNDDRRVFDIPAIGWAVVS